MKISLGAFFRGAIFLGDLLPGGNFPGGNFLGGIFPGGFFPGGIFPDTDKIYRYIFGVSCYSYKGKQFSFIVKEMFIEIGWFKEVWVLKNLFPMMYIFQGHTKIVKTYICNNFK